AIATSTNWSGYAVTTPNGAVTSVAGSWTIPTANGPSTRTGGDAAAWVGIDGYNSNTVEQIGTETEYSKSGGAFSYAWIELYPNDYWVWSLPGTKNGDVPAVNAGDII